MTLAQRLLPLALLSIASYDSQAAGRIGSYTAEVAPFSASATLASEYLQRGIRPSDERPAAQWSLDYRRPGGRPAATRTAGDDRVKREIGGAIALDPHAGGEDRRDPKAGLSRELEGGWALSGSYGRAFGANGNSALAGYTGAMPRAELRPPSGGKSRGGALAMSLSRRF